MQVYLGQTAFFKVGEGSHSNIGSIHLPSPDMVSYKVNNGGCGGEQVFLLCVGVSFVLQTF